MSETTATETDDSSSSSSDPANDVSPSGLQPQARSCFSSSKNFFQCQASSPEPTAHQHGHGLAKPPSHIVVQGVVNGWYGQCCNTDLPLAKCAQSVHFSDNCQPTGDYFLNYISDPNDDQTSSAASTTATSSPAAQSGDSEVSSGAIAGAVVGAVAGTALMALLVAALIWKRRQTQQGPSERGEDSALVAAKRGEGSQGISEQDDTLSGSGTANYIGRAPGDSLLTATTQTVSSRGNLDKSDGMTRLDTPYYHEQGLNQLLAAAQQRGDLHFGTNPATATTAAGMGGGALPGGVIPELPTETQQHELPTSTILPPEQAPPPPAPVVPTELPATTPVEPSEHPRTHQEES